MPAIRPRKAIEYTVDPKGCHVCISHSTDNDGYPRLFRNGRLKRLSRVFYEGVHGAIPKGGVVRHTCDNPRCINPDHLIVGTHADNAADRVARGRSACGARNGRTKLTEAQVRCIRVSIDTIAADARKYGVDPKSIRLIRNRKNWAWLPD